MSLPYHASLLMSGKLMTFSDGHGEVANSLSRLNASGRYNDFNILYQFTHECQSLQKRFLNPFECCRLDKKVDYKNESIVHL